MSIDTVIKTCSPWIPDIENNCTVSVVKGGSEIIVFHLTDRYWIHVTSDVYGIDIQFEDYQTGSKFDEYFLSNQDFIMCEALEYIENNIPRLEK